MTTAIITHIAVSREPATTFRAFIRKLGAMLRHAIELSGESYLVQGSRYL